MATLTIEIDDTLLQRVQNGANERHESVDAYVADALAQRALNSVGTDGDSEADILRVMERLSRGRTVLPSTREERNAR